VAFSAPPPAHIASHNGLIETPMQMCTHLPQHMPRHASVPPFGTLLSAVGMGADGLQRGMPYPQACVHHLPDYASALDLGHGACALPPYLPPGVAAGGGMVNTAVPTRMPACPPAPALVAPLPQHQCSVSHAVVAQKAAYPPASVSDASCHQQRQACTLLFPGPGQPFHASSAAEGPGQQPFNRLAAGTPTAAIETALMGGLSSVASEKEVPAPSLKRRAHDSSSGMVANSGAADDPSRVVGKRKKLEHQLAKGIRELHGVDRAASDTLTSHPEFKKMRANVVRKLTAMHAQLGDLAKSTSHSTEVACAPLPSAVPEAPAASQDEAIAAPRTALAPASAEMSYSAPHPLLPSRPQLPMPFNSRPLQMPSLLQQEVPHGGASTDSDVAGGGDLQVGEKFADGEHTGSSCRDPFSRQLNPQLSLGKVSEEARARMEVRLAAKLERAKQTGSPVDPNGVSQEARARMEARMEARRAAARAERAKKAVEPQEPIVGLDVVAETIDWLTGPELTIDWDNDYSFWSADQELQEDADLQAALTSNATQL